MKTKNYYVSQKKQLLSHFQSNFLESVTKLNCLKELDQEISISIALFSYLDHIPTEMLCLNPIMRKFKLEKVFGLREESLGFKLLAQILGEVIYLDKPVNLSNNSTYFDTSVKEVVSFETKLNSTCGVNTLIGTYEHGDLQNHLTIGAPMELQDGKRGLKPLDIRRGEGRSHSISSGEGTGGRLTKEENYGIAHIQSSLSNTIISITDRLGNVLTWSSAGTSGFKGSRRSIQYAAQLTGENVARKSVQLGLKVVEARIQGIGFGKDSALRGLQIGGLKIIQLCDITSIPHNGCRAPKKRRT
jgi:small subunit ribosomal protein S11